MPPTPLDAAALARITDRTLRDYDDHAEAFRSGTADHDVSQNMDAMLVELPGVAPHRILDFGCGPGRDLIRFKALGHHAVGLDGAPAFVAMARRDSGCEVWQQNFLALRLPPAHFHGVFANASLFHVPEQELLRVLRALWDTLMPDGILFASNPRGEGGEGWNGERYGCRHHGDGWYRHGHAAGFKAVRHYYRPAGKPRHQQPWLATVWRKVAAPDVTGGEGEPGG